MKSSNDVRSQSWTWTVNRLSNGNSASNSNILQEKLGLKLKLKITYRRQSLTQKIKLAPQASIALLQLMKL